jgi:hypothetical protein
MIRSGTNSNRESVIQYKVFFTAKSPSLLMRILPTIRIEGGGSCYFSFKFLPVFESTSVVQVQNLRIKKG